MPSKRDVKLQKMKAAKKTAKAERMRRWEEGGKKGASPSRCGQRAARSRNGAPMADRGHEGRPWFMALIVPPRAVHAPGFAQWLRDFQRMVG